MGALLVVAAWAAVLAVEVGNLPSMSLLALLVPPFELALWVTACFLTLRALRRAHSGRLLIGGTALVLAAACLHFTNWGSLQPSSYFALHRYAFDAVADGVRDGRIGTSEEYYGEPLPWYLRDLATDGNASVVGRQDGLPVVFLPQWFDIPDDAGGYVFLDAEPRPGLEVDLYANPAIVVDGIDLGGGWWYLPGPGGFTTTAEPARRWDGV